MKRMLIIILGCMMISSCGVKPGAVEPPEGAETNAYPLTYPDISTDPAAQ